MKKQIVTKMVSAALIAGMTVGLAGCGNGLFRQHKNKGKDTFYRITVE